MSAMTSQITSHTTVHSTVYSGADQRKHQSSALPAFVGGIHRSPVNSPHKGPVTWKMFPFDDVIMASCQTAYQSGTVWLRLHSIACNSRPMDLLARQLCVIDNRIWYDLTLDDIISLRFKRFLFTGKCQHLCVCSKSKNVRVVYTLEEKRSPLLGAKRPCVLAFYPTIFYQMVSCHTCGYCGTEHLNTL